MCCKKLYLFILIASIVTIVVFGSIAIAELSKDSKASDQPEIMLPPGWTEEDMKACEIAGTPGKMHEHLAARSGVWEGKTTMWMFPGSEPLTGECTSTIKTMLDGRFIMEEMKGEMTGMGSYHGMGFYGFDNVSHQLVSNWIDNHGTGIANGVGEISEDGNTIVCEYTYNCPITKKPAVLRETEQLTGPNARTFEMFARDPKTGQEFKMMRIEFTRK